MLSKEDKQSLITKYGENEKDSGSPKVQVALITERVKYLTEHLKVNRKDAHSRRGLRKLLGKRTRLLRYFKHKDLQGYRAFIKELGLKDKV